MSRDQQAAFAANMEQQILQQYGLLVPGQEYVNTGMGVA